MKHKETVLLGKMVEKKDKTTALHLLDITVSYVQLM